MNRPFLLLATSCNAGLELRDLFVLGPLTRIAMMIVIAIIEINIIMMGVFDVVN